MSIIMAGALKLVSEHRVALDMNQKNSFLEWINEAEMFLSYTIIVHSTRFNRCEPFTFTVTDALN